MIPIWLIIIIGLWSLPWKGIALWKAARRKHLVWFIIFLLVNLLAIPEIVYLIVTRKKK
ncbi:hypothetical protein KY317_03675 [Candidatus Woesearchaeota archaeon]|nr:hypothetical protein [Candidatus Woesearchaeota archaeon]